MPTIWIGTNFDLSLIFLLHWGNSHVIAIRNMVCRLKSVTTKYQRKQEVYLSVKTWVWKSETWVVNWRPPHKTNRTFVKLSWFWRISNKLTENSKFLTLILNDVTKTPTAIVLETSKICFYAKSERSSTSSHWFRFKFTIHFTKFTKCILNHKIMLLSLICLCFLSYVYKNEIRRYPTQHLIPAVWCNLAFCIWFWPLSWDLHPKRF